MPPRITELQLDLIFHLTFKLKAKGTKPLIQPPEAAPGTIKGRARPVLTLIPGLGA